MPMFGVEVTVRDGPTLRLDEPWHQHHSSRSSSLARTSTNVPLLSSSDSTIIKSSTSSSEAAAVPVNTLLMTTESLSSTMSQATMSTVVAPHSPLTEVVSPPHPETTETRTTTEISVLHTSIASSPTPSTSTPQSRIGIVEQALPGVAAGVVISISLIIAGGVFFLCRRRSKIIRTRQRASARSEFREERRAGESSQPADDIVILSRDIEAQEGSGREGQEEAPDNHGVYQHEGNGGSLLGTSIHALPRKLGILAIESPPVPNTSRNSKVRFSEPVLRVALSRISTLSHHNPLRASMTTVTPDSNSRLMLDSAATRAAPVNSR
ncbi:hypothetical protein D9756_007925 [Leucocoprinus leucothites]|uniref:Uncharacterized protein n=1 Tax=Leucocoprinus leucothites TaxID=201217 RepID=A0A8H5D520_9AGAR|nr:hypothetical protein D9756_007925 [Leucoagaricus leucothites]